MNICSFGGVGLLALAAVLPTVSVLANGSDAPCIFDDYLGTVLDGQSFSAIERDGNVGYCVSDDGVFTSFDLTDVSSPTVLGTLEIGRVDFERIVVRDGVAHIVQRFGFYQTVDVSDPASPVLLGTLPGVLIRSDLAVGDDGRVILDFFPNTIIFVDASDPGMPELVEALVHPMGGELEGYAIDGTTAYIATDVDGTLTLEVWDITDLGNRVLLSSEVVRMNDQVTSAAAIAIDESVVYVLDQESGLYLYDVTDPGMPVFLSSLGTGRGQRLTIDGGMVFISDEFEAIQIVDASDPLEPELVGSYDIQGPVWGVTSKDQTMMVSGGDGFELIDISDPANPYAGRVETTRAADLGLIGDLAIVADTIGGVKFVDVSDIDNPMIVHSTPGSGQNVFESGKYAFVASGHLGLDIWDVSDPAQIVYSGGLDSTDHLIADVFVEGQYAYITDQGVDLMKVIDVSDVGNPTIVGSVPINERSGPIVVSEGRAYVGSFNDDRLAGVLEVIDVQAPMDPSLIGSIDLPDTVLGIDVRWPYAYIADRTAGFKIVDIADPQSMSVIGEFETDGTAVDLQLVDDIAFVVNNRHGVELIDIQTPENPMLIGSYANENSASGLRVVDGVLYLSSSDLGLEIVDLRVGCVDCKADLTGDGLLDFFDISLFLQRYGASDLSVDLNGDGSLDFFDISAFLVFFQNGCS